MEHQISSIANTCQNISITRKHETNVDIHKYNHYNHIDPPFTYHTNLTMKKTKNYLAFIAISCVCTNIYPPLLFKCKQNLFRHLL